ncbi:uncharacterized protein PG998_010550 [Apiospora kogelbergensis]|uniref:uncharacterized protein n=1 Tax=Apiospora kogelbergensis TaxID=1337665 RepID=UPI00312ECD1F
MIPTASQWIMVPAADVARNGIRPFSEGSCINLIPESATHGENIAHSGPGYDVPQLQHLKIGRDAICIVFVAQNQGSVTSYRNCGSTSHSENILFNRRLHGNPFSPSPLEPQLIKNKDIAEFDACCIETARHPGDFNGDETSAWDSDEPGYMNHTPSISTRASSEASNSSAKKEPTFSREQHYDANEPRTDNSI